MAATVPLEEANEVLVGDLDEAVGANRHYRLLQRLERLKVHVVDTLVRHLCLLHSVVVDHYLYVVLECQFVDAKEEEESDEGGQEVDNDEMDRFPEFIEFTANNLELHGQYKYAATDERRQSHIFLLYFEHQREI